MDRAQRKTRLLGSICASLLGVLVIGSLMTFLGIPSGLRPRVYWLLSSRNYKRAVLSAPVASYQLAHEEWDGDGWGGLPVGDWTSYVVYDPNDSLPALTTSELPKKINGIPCDVVAVRRLEKSWYSVVTDMNQFWDSRHPTC